MRAIGIAIVLLLMPTFSYCEETRWSFVLVHFAGGKWQVSEGSATVTISEKTISFIVHETGFESLDEKRFIGNLESAGQNTTIYDVKSEIPQSGPGVGSPYKGTLYYAYPQTMEGDPITNHTEIINLINEYRFIGISRHVKQ